MILKGPVLPRLSPFVLNTLPKLSVTAQASGRHQKPIVKSPVPTLKRLGLLKVTLPLSGMYADFCPSNAWSDVIVTLLVEITELPKASTTCPS